MNLRVTKARLDGARVVALIKGDEEISELNEGDEGEAV